PLLKPGELVIAKNNAHYEVVEMLGEGGFGEVYKVSSKRNPEKVYAMKVESNDKDPKKTSSLIKIDRAGLYIYIINRKNRLLDEPVFRCHFPGATPSFKFYMMDLIGMSLKEVIRTMLGDVTSPHTKIAIARQTIIAIENLHKLGFIHRDIKWHNFAIGLPPKEHIIYILDFGIARPYVDEKYVHYVPREKVQFMGTFKYASIAGLESREQSKKEDLEIWLYMMME
ncbi:hypothetical protein PMAYCL1PPCAC_26793, partial [Pristionchus mayeri]